MARGVQKNEWLSSYLQGAYHQRGRSSPRSLRRIATADRRARHQAAKHCDRNARRSWRIMLGPISKGTMRLNPARYSLIRCAAIAMLAASVAFLSLTSHTTGETYPIPFESEPDWQTNVQQYPTGSVAQLVPNNGLKGSLILIRLIAKSKSLTAEDAARIAYNQLFVSNGARSPGPGSFVAIVIYGRPDPAGSISEFGFVFRHDSGNSWEPRPVAKRDVAAIRSALQQPPEPSNATSTARDYPIPFNNNADYRGVVSTLPLNMPFSVLTGKSRVLDHALVVIQMSTDQALSYTQTARYAYLAVFKNERRLPHGAVYIVVNIYGPPTSYEPGGSVLVFPKAGYIFSRDSGGRWKPRPVSEKELDAIEAALAAAD